MVFRHPLSFQCLHRPMLRHLFGDELDVMIIKMLDRLLESKERLFQCKFLGGVQIVALSAELRMRCRGNCKDHVAWDLVWALIRLHVVHQVVILWQSLLHIDAQSHAGLHHLITVAGGALPPDAFPLTMAMRALLLHLLHKSRGELDALDLRSAPAAVRAHDEIVLGRRTCSFARLAKLLLVELHGVGGPVVHILERDQHQHVNVRPLVRLLVSAAEPEQGSEWVVLLLLRLFQLLQALLSTKIVHFPLLAVA
mmetsp:Transcript_81788/g.95458  ORF Transcript_81788/g.95458 Transcript_81788/m.95458 type:complete len:253 (-) Transcript_81788:296-1054(-)